MSQQSHDIAVLNRMVEHEEAVAQLYGLFRKHYTGDSAFWGWLEEQERGHADALRQLTEEVRGGRLGLGPNRFSLDSVNTSLQFVRQHIEAFIPEKTRRHDAVDTALRIERLMLELKTFDTFADDHQRFRDTLDRLRQETLNHRERLSRAERRLRGLLALFARLSP